MKATELMIGDWVDWVEFGHSPVRVAILGAAQDSLGLAAGNNVFGQPYSMIVPIPLTEEILDKNGFSINDDYFWEWERKEGVFITAEIRIYKEEDDDVWQARMSGPNVCDIDDLNIRYVHELQHALRLLGVDVDIEL